PITRPRLSPTARRAPGHRGRDDGRRAASVSARVRPSQAALVPNSLTVAPLRPSPAFSPLAAPLVVEDSDPKLDLQGFTRPRRHGQALAYFQFRGGAGMPRRRQAPRPRRGAAHRHET